MRHRLVSFALCFAALTLTAACAPEAALPTFTPPPATAAALNLLPTRDLHGIPTRTPAPTERPTSTAAPSRTPMPTRAPTATVLSWLAQRDPYLARVPAAETGDEVIGYSGGNHALVARRAGSGPRVLLLVGGIHGGWEQNTVALVERLADHFAAHPEAVPAGWSIVFVPAANPDGLLLGRTPEGRFNRSGVDLNRNWGCGWQPQAVWRETPVSPGTAAFSEPETQALAALILRLRPQAALFYHSQAGAIYEGDCPGTAEDVDSAALAAVYGTASGYAYGEAFAAYPVTGTAAAWADGHGVYSADVELRTSNLTEFDVNLRGVLAVIAWLEEE
jgi:hypothetical protein